MKEREFLQQKNQRLEEENQQLREQLKLLPPSSDDPNK
jgi:cell division septum initiation protein DivIVA